MNPKKVKTHPVPQFRLAYVCFIYKADLVTQLTCPNPCSHKYSGTKLRLKFKETKITGFEDTLIRTATFITLAVTAPATLTRERLDMAVASASVNSGTLSPDPSLPRSSATFGPGGGGRNDVTGNPGKEAKREIPEVSVNGAPLRMPRPQKSGNLNNGNTNGVAGGLGAEGEGGEWGSQFWVTLVDPQVGLLIQLNIWNCGQIIIFS